MPAGGHAAGGSDAVVFHAVAGDKQSRGATAGQALDALTAQLSGTAAAQDTLVIVQRGQPEDFFNDAQRRRLEELVGRWRMARARGEALPPGEAEELESLVEAELRAAGRRASAFADQVARG